MKQKIALKYSSSIFISNNDSSDHNNAILVASINSELMQNGFMLSQDSSTKLGMLSDVELTDIYKDIVTEVRILVGNDVDYQPMYPNFPEQVMNASASELFLNAITHYWTHGEWSPSYEKLPREISFENVNFKEINLIHDVEFNKIFETILSSNDSISDFDRETIAWFVDTHKQCNYENLKIPFKENMCFLAGLLAANNEDISKLPQTATDVLRIATVFSGGDISLAENTKFKSLPRKLRRMLVSALENVANLDDLMRHRGKWIRLFHNLHISELTKSANLLDMVELIRSGKNIETFNSKVELTIANKDPLAAIALLKTRPGDFARRISCVLGLKVPGRRTVVEEFLKVANQVSTRVLLQLMGSLKIRGNSTTDKRVIFPKGSIQKAQIVNTELPKLGIRATLALTNGVKEVLTERFSSLDNLGCVYIDPDLKKCPLPSQQRSASEGLIQVARGTHLPIGDDKNTLRFFVYWIGQDIDLSATFHDENFRTIGNVSYRNLQNKLFGSYHSGDKTKAPNGECEFIDVNIDDAVKSGTRYVVMNVLVYSGPKFSEHEKCYVGWMTRSQPNSNEIFDAKTVDQKIDLASECLNSIPVVFDLVERKAIWTDLSTSKNVQWGGNNVESNRATIEDKLEAITSLNNKTNLFELFELHAMARSTAIVDDPENAEMIFSVENCGDITPSNIMLINSEYLTDSTATKKENV